MNTRAQAILSDPGVREFYALLEIAKRQTGGDEKLARRMLEAYYRGQCDRERLDREQVAA